MNAVSYLDKVNCPNDIKTMTIEELNCLSDEIRQGILNRANTLSGHLGPDLGFVEPTLALHYVFNSPVDKFILDVSHQCYAHKMITQRKSGFIDNPINSAISGYSNDDESVHDFFKIGHTSTSISLALGVTKARDLKNEKYNVIAVIGDGSLSGGEALEGLNNASVLKGNFIIVLNDNEMSIAPTNGGLYRALKELRQTNGMSQNNMFKAMGFDYYYLNEGNDIEKLIETFKKVKDTAKPTVVHIHTLKGKGYKPAQDDKESYHFVLNGFLDTNSDNNSAPQENFETYNSITVDYLLKKKEKDNSLIVVSPATPGVSGFDPSFREKMGDNYIDVDIAEQHAVGYVSGLAKNGAKPVLAVLSSFVQRAYDQLSQDLALNNSPATILVYWGAITSADMTHLNIFDIPLISNIPNIVYLSPVNKEEYLQMLDWSIEQNKHPVVIRVPFGGLISTGIKDNTDYSILNKYKMTHKGQKIALIGAGNFYYLASSIKDEIQKQLGIDATLINPVYLSGVDEKMLEDLKSEHNMVLTFEDGCIEGGFGEKITRFYGNCDMKVINYGAKKEFTDRVSLSELYQRYHLTPELVIEDIKKII